MPRITAEQARARANLKMGAYDTEYQQQLDSIMEQINLAMEQGYLSLCLKDPLAIFWVEQNLYNELTGPELKYKITWLSPGILEISWE